MLIPGNFKSNDFASADSRGFADASFATANPKGLASAEVRQRAGVRQSVTTYGSLASAKLLVGFALHVTSLAIVVNWKTALRQRKRARLIRRDRRHRGRELEGWENAVG